MLFFLLSLILNGGFLFLLIVIQSDQTATKDFSSKWRGGKKTNQVTVKLSQSESFSDSLASKKQKKTPIPKKEKPSNNTKKQISFQKRKPTSQKAKTASSQKISGQTSNSFGDGLDSDGSFSPSTLAIIRKKIDRKKFMPLMAQEKNLSGAVKVKFQINKDGQIQSLDIIKKSGHAILDRAALNTIRKAAPYPYYKNPIALVLEYQ